MAETQDGGIAVTVNGRPVTFRCDPGLPLLEALREQLDLKATRFGCGQATCGACTVIIDGRAAQSCDVPVADLAGARIETAECLDTQPPHPLLSAVLDHQAGQCGYCLPGILMAAKALLDADPAPDRQRIAEALDGNLCRCGAQARILDAIEDCVARQSMGGPR